MWIRSQDQANYLDAAGKTFSINNKNQIYLRYANSSILLGEYSSSEKALNVLNKLRKQNDEWHTFTVYYSNNKASLSISSINDTLTVLKRTNTFEMPKDEDV